MGDYLRRLSESFSRVIKKELGGIDYPGMVIFWLIIIISVFLVYFIKSRMSGENRNYFKEVLVILTLMYLVVIAELTVMGREKMPDRIVRLMLFRSENNLDDTAADILNFMFFVPWGFLVALYPEKDRLLRRFGMVFLGSFLISFLVETVQYALQIGYFEVIDMKTNIIGGLCGALLSIVLFHSERD